MTINDTKTISNISGILMSDEEYKEWEKCFIDMQENIEYVYKYGEDYDTVYKNEQKSNQKINKIHKSNK
jgi:hypothetical protein